MKKTKGMLAIEIEKGERLYQFLMPIGAPIGEAYDSVHECLQELLDMAKLAAENAKPQLATDDKQEEKKIIES